MASHLRAAGETTSQGEACTRGAVWSLRPRWGMASARPGRPRGGRRQWPEGRDTRAGVAAGSGGPRRTVHTWMERGLLVPSHTAKGGPIKSTLSQAQLES